MTVAAVIVASTPDEALRDAAGRPAVRRIVDAAWAGGALPIVVVAVDAEGAVSGVLAGSPALLVAATGAGERSDYLAGSEAAGRAVAETTACLLWPGRMVWVDPETVTSLIEAHGRDLERVARPAIEGTPGWPVLLPSQRAAAVLSAEGTDLAEVLAEFDAGVVELDLGDPGSIHGYESSIDELPPYSGPPQPVGGPPPEWGAAAADVADPETTDR